MRRIDLRKSFLVFSIALAAVASSSCSRQAALYPAEGKVFFEGEPASGALVVLHPVDNSAPDAVRPSGYVDAEGQFRLTSYAPPSRSHGDGAPPGDYIVTITWLPPDVKEHLSKRPNAPLPDKLQGRYSQPQNSTLRAKVLERSTELPPIELKKEGAMISVTQGAFSFVQGAAAHGNPASAGGPTHD